MGNGALYMEDEEKNKKIVTEWSDKKKKLHFWYWCGVTDFGEKKGINPYSTEIVEKFNKRCSA